MDVLELLAVGEIDIEGRMPYSSNGTFLVHVTRGEHSTRAIYKPLRGERPLWDFPPGLYRREVAAYLLSEAMGLGIVPPTVEREGPLGIGSLQWFVEADLAQHYFTLFESRPELHDQFRNIAAFDVVVNNTDRKSGHCLVDEGGRVWAIDNGLCFASDFKLRTVIWEFGGEPLDPDLHRRIRAVADEPPSSVTSLLFDDEVEALVERAALLADGGTLPIDASGHRYPWPMV